MNITQSAILELDDVSLNSSTINLNLHTYVSSNYGDPMLTGTFGISPTKIVLIKSDEDNSKIPDDKEKFLLFKGTFTTTCNEWKDKINFEGAQIVGIVICVILGVAVIVAVILIVIILRR